MKYRLNRLFNRLGYWLITKTHIITATEIAMMEEAKHRADREETLWVHIDCKCGKKYCVDFTVPGAERAMMFEDQSRDWKYNHKHKVPK